MDDELDKILNRQSGFRYPTLDAKKEVRLLRALHGESPQVVSYVLDVVPLEDLSWTHYRALSYTWGCAQIESDIQEIQVDGQPLFIRRNLFDFLKTAAAKDEYGLFFIDAMCINQLDHNERQYQVQQMSRIYHNANEVIAWLGLPDTSQFDNVRALSQTKSNDCVTWTSAQWEGFRYLSYHRYWRRVWVTQEVLLASRLDIWCGFFTFSPRLFETTLHNFPSPRARVTDKGRPVAVVDASSRLCTPAEITLTHRLHPVLRPPRETFDLETNIGTWEEMRMDLRKSSTVVDMARSQRPDLLYQIIRKFSKLECSDPRDRLYGLLGIVDQRTRAKVKPDYTKDVSYAYYQALKVGMQEIYLQHGPLSFSYHHKYVDNEYLGYYCDVRDAFDISDVESIPILRQVLGELRFPTRFQEAIFEVQWQQQFVLRDAEISLYPDFKQLLEHAQMEPTEHAEAEGLLKFHKGQRRMVDKILSRLQRRRCPPHT